MSDYPQLIRFDDGTVWQVYPDHAEEQKRLVPLPGDVLDWLEGWYNRPARRYTDERLEDSRYA